MTHYNHMFDIAFSVVSTQENPELIDAHELRQALLERLAGLDDAELDEAVGYCDTYEEATP